MDSGSDDAWWVTGAELVTGSCVTDGVLKVLCTRLIEQWLRHRRDVARVMPRLLLRCTSSSRSMSNCQKPPFPGSFLERGTFTKHLFRDRLCRIEFCGTQNNLISNSVRPHPLSEVCAIRILAYASKLSVFNQLTGPHFTHILCSSCLSSIFFPAA
jgi:hypothetical protein